MSGHGKSDDRIKEAMVTNAHTAAQRVMTAIGENPEIQRTGNVAHVLGETAFIAGLDVGLAVAIQDVAAARKLMAWVTANVLEDDADSVEERDRIAGELLTALGFEHD